MTRSYSECISIPTFQGRYDYLRETALVGEAKFGGRRFLNQDFYRSKEWKQARRDAIVRDSGYDLAFDRFEIPGKIYVHHINILTEEDLRDGSDNLFDLENLICVSYDTHQAIHYGDQQLLPQYIFIERKPGDTRMWQPWNLNSIIMA